VAFRQLYYTSCERGLSGYPGYQFNAVSRGVTVDEMREVERLTAYEPPASLGFAPSEAEIAACPASLCYAPGPTAILANVVFLGADFSQRFGNYFAHALVSGEPERDLCGRLPIEAWAAPCWTRAVSASPELPALSGPVVGGVVDRGRVGAIVAGDPAIAHLPRLLTAVLGAVGGGARPVVLVGPNAERNAAWIAAVSYLLPEPLVRRMSFTTYHRRPRHCRLHVVATVPGDGGLREAPDGLALFDLVDGWTNADDPHPLAILLASLGVSGVEGLWADAARLTGSLPDTADELHQVALVTLARRAARLSPPDLGAAVAWFASRARLLGPGLVAELGRALAAQPDAGEADLREVLRAAAAAGVEVRSERLERIEWVRIDTTLGRLARSGAAGPVSISSETVRAQAAGAVRDRLAGAGPGETAALLRWASVHAVPLPEDVQAAGGERLIGSVLAGERSPAELQDLAAGWPGVLRGVVDRLELAASGDPDRVLELLSGGLDDLVTRDQPPPRLRELCAVLDSRRQESPAATLERLVAERRRRGDRGAFDDLLRLLWPSGEWSHGDAAEVVQRLRQEVAAGDVPAWLDRAAARPPAPGDRPGRLRYLLLCELLARHPVREALEERTRAAVSEVARTNEALRQAEAPDSRGAQAILGLVRDYGRLSDPLREYLLDTLPTAILGLDPPRLAMVLDGCPQPLLREWMAHARARLDRHAPDPELGARVFRAVVRYAHPAAEWRHRAEYDLLAATLPFWPGRRWRELARHLARSEDPDAEPVFLAWRERWDGRLGHRMGRAALRQLRRLRRQLGRVGQSRIRRRR
jgi:hypothetical protein